MIYAFFLVTFQTFVNEETLQKLPCYLQYKLITLLPKCDQNINGDGSLTYVQSLKNVLIMIYCQFFSHRLSDEAFTNEFFTKACEEWRNKLAEGLHIIFTIFD